MINNDIVEFMIECIPRHACILKHHRPTSHGPAVIKINSRKCWFILALIIRITGKQWGPKENKINVNPRREVIQKVAEEFTQEGINQMPGIDIMERLVTYFLINQEVMNRIMENLHNFIFALGECVAGDEKLFHYTADDHLVRAVQSKPDKVGIWFYELCALLTNGTSILICSSYHNNHNGEMKVFDIVRQWINTIMSCGKNRVENGLNPNPNTMLVFDSYYTTRKSVELCEQFNVIYSASLTFDRMKDEIKFLKGKNHVDNEKGEWVGMQNIETNRVIVYCYDTGLKKARYNVSNGFIRNGSDAEIKKRLNEVPVYDYYKVSFKYCDLFNRSLHHKKWPFRRGGKNVRGAEGKIHDFFFASVLQNTFNIYRDILKINEPLDFLLLCDELSLQVYNYALTLFE